MSLNLANQEVEAQMRNIVSGENHEYEKADHKTVARALLESGLSPEELTANRLRDETHLISLAGINTVLWVFVVGSFHLLNRRDLHQHLLKELESAFPNPDEPPPLKELEKLPYLTAVILECEFHPLTSKVV